MINYFRKRYALSEKGAKDFVRAIIYNFLLNIVLMLPAVLTFLFLEDYLRSLGTNDTSINNGFWYYIALGVGFMIITYFIAILQYNSSFTAVYTESGNRRIALAEKLRQLPLAFFGEKNLSDLTSTIMEDNTMLEGLFSHAVPQLYSAAMSLTLVGIGLAFYQWQLALALLWVVPFAWGVFFIAKRSLDKGVLKHYKVKRDVTESVQEGIESIQEIKAYNGEKAYLSSLKEKLKIYETTLIKTEIVTGSVVNLSYSLLRLGLATVIITGAYLLSTGQIELIVYLIFLMVAASIYNPINDALNNFAALMILNVRINRMKEMEEMPIQQGKTEYSVPNYDIEFKNVYFAYEEGKSVLSDVSFTAKQGEVTALVGPSGGGKTTATKLAARFWDINSGTITLGGEDISQIDPEALLKNYSIVFQDVLLFNASIADNIRIGKKDASDEEIKRVARLAQCEEFINRMPNGYDTIIGENGAALSGGERQRISIARALLKDAPIVLLDEATASLDVENETKIQAGISELIKNKTVLIIAHRMRTVANAHKVIVLRDGKVSESGSPSELIAAGGEFANMLNRQKQ